MVDGVHGNMNVPLVEIEHVSLTSQSLPREIHHK